ncbi:MAG TPA: hypothetical protein PK659_02500 [Methanothrix sp.]|nr:hypothetical protein [Methanothrix sp.]HOK57706.1 hypothetical protein [Methanothrix sp.]HOL43109.1 hypothetical protein [Methanothrix sp.]HPO88111.1 hypothetical protein [Methanothrix sp.]
MSGIEEAIRRLEEIAGRHICAARRDELLEIIEILRRELERNKTSGVSPPDSLQHGSEPSAL